MISFKELMLWEIGALIMCMLFFSCIIFNPFNKSRPNVPSYMWVFFNFLINGYSPVPSCFLYMTWIVNFTAH